MTDDQNIRQEASGTARAKMRGIASGFGAQLALVLLYLGVATVIPGSAADKVAAFAMLLVGIVAGCGVSYFMFRFLIVDQLLDHREDVRSDARSLAINVNARMESALATVSATTAGLIIPDQALLALESDTRKLRRVVIASADGPDEFLSNPGDRNSALDFGAVVKRNLRANVAYEWWSLDSRRANAACSDAQGFLNTFENLATLHLVSTDDWAVSPFSFDTIFLAFKDGHTDAYMQLPSQHRTDVFWIQLPSEVRKDFQGVIDGWRRGKAQAAAAHMQSQPSAPEASG